MSPQQEPTTEIAHRRAWLPAPGHLQADAVAAALDKVLLRPSAANRAAAFVAVQTYLAATEHLWNDSTTQATR